MNWMWVSSLVIVFDQITKRIADNNLDLRVPLEIIPGLNMTLCYNRGAAFSFLNNAGGWQRWFLMTVSFLISVALIVWLSQVDKSRKQLYWGLALLLGGAVGNLIDRTIFGYVIDFIDVYYQYWHWPAFNIADSAISIGAGLLILDMITYKETN